MVKWINRYGGKMKKNMGKEKKKHCRHTIKFGSSEMFWYYAMEGDRQFFLDKTLSSIVYDG